MPICDALSGSENQTWFQVTWTGSGSYKVVTLWLAPNSSFSLKELFLQKFQFWFGSTHKCFNSDCRTSSENQTQF